MFLKVPPYFSYDKANRYLLKYQIILNFLIVSELFHPLPVNLTFIQ